MTREDAIAILKHKVLACLRGTKWGEALEMAIKALEQEPTTKIEESNFSQDQYLADIQSAYDCGYEQAKNNLAVDCISRADALDCVNWGYSFSDIYKKINELPPVTPQPRWIPVSERLPDTDDEVLCWYEYYHWSQEKVLPEYGFGSYFKETKAWFGEVAIGKDVRVIAWMSLPQAYREVEE